MIRYKDDDFGNMIKSIRKNKKIKAETLVKGICSVKVLSNLESGKVLSSYLLRNILIERLGFAVEWFENMLTVEEYEEWRHRKEIINLIRKKEYIEADKIIEKYKEKYIGDDEEDIGSRCQDEGNEQEAKQKLRIQFYFTMKGMCAGNDAAQYYERAAAMTSYIYHDGYFDNDMLMKYKLSINELNMYFEIVKAHKDTQEILKVIDTLIHYMDVNYYDNKSKEKFLPKLVVHYCRLNDKTKDINVLRRMWELCHDAVELLRKGKKAYYIVELFEIQMKLVDRLCHAIKGASQTQYCKQMRTEKRKIKLWHDTIVNEYERRGVCVYMSNDFYIYQEGSAYCINDVIRARRTLLGYSRKSLCVDICAEKTIEKTEQHKSNLQYLNMKRIYDRLNLPCVYQNSSLIVSDILDLEKEEEIDNLVANEELMLALSAINELRNNIPSYTYNLQGLGKVEILIMYQLGKISPEEALERSISQLELTLPMECIDTFIKNRERGVRKKQSVNKAMYLTQCEIRCIIHVVRYYGMLGNSEKAKDYMDLLYEYFTQNADNEMYCMENIFCLFMVQYTSLLGDYGMYELSDELADLVAKRQLELYRPQQIWWHKYNNLWNDNLKEKDKEKYNSVLKECAFLCQIYGDENTENIFKKKIIKTT